MNVFGIKAIADLGGKITDVIGQHVKDKDLALRLQTQITTQVVGVFSKLMELQSKILTAEMNGNWMLVHANFASDPAN